MGEDDRPDARRVRLSGFALLDPAGRVLHWSLALAELTGVPAGRAVGRDLGLLYSPAEAGPDEPALDLHAAERDGTVTRTGTFLFADGWANGRLILTAQARDDGRVRGFGAFLQRARPTGPRDQAPGMERAERLVAGTLAVAGRADVERGALVGLTDSLDTYRRVLDLSPDAIVVTDEHGRILDLNAAAHGLLFARDTARADKPLAQFVPAAHRREFRELLLRLRREARVDDVPLVLDSRDGRRAHLLARAVLGQGTPPEPTIVHWTLRPLDEGVAAREAARGALVHAVEEERMRIARELHDVLGQTLTALSLEVKALEATVRGAAARERLGRVRDLVASVSGQAHGIAHGLRPAGLAELGLERTLRVLATEWSERTGVPVDFHAAGLAPRLPYAVEAALYRVAQEGLTNVARHAEAGRASLVVERSPTHVMMALDDDGRGFVPSAVALHSGRRLGLLGMRERVALVGGTLTVESARGQGTSVVVRVPLAATSVLASDDDAADGDG